MGAVFGDNTQAVAIVQIQSPETSNLLYCAERAVQPQVFGVVPLDGDGLVPLIAQVIGVPLAIFLNALPEGREVVAIKGT